MASETRTTTDHDEIRSWVEEHDGTPARVRGTGAEGSGQGSGQGSDDGSGVLRIDFPGGAGEDQLEHVDWDTWFQTFDDSGLALLYQAEKTDGSDSTFNKLVSR